MNPSLKNCLIEKKLLLQAIKKLSDTLQEPRFWDPTTYQAIPYRLVRKVDAKVHEAVDLIKQSDEFNTSNDENASRLYNSRKELEVLQFLITEDVLMNHE